MAFSDDWSAWWRGFLGSPPDRDLEALEVLRQRYVEERQQIERFKQHAHNMRYPQFQEKLLQMATEKSKYAESMAKKIVALGGKLPEVPEDRLTDKNSWRHLLMALEEENRSADHLPEQLRNIESHHPDIAQFLRQISQEQKKHRDEIRSMLMRSDPFALSLA